VNTNADSIDERIWMALHGASGAAEREALERDSRGDPDLRERLAHAHRLDGLLRTCMPRVGEESGDQLADRACVAWEAEQASGTWQADGAPSARGRVFRQRPWFPSVVIGFAGLVAASLALLLSPVMWQAREVRWLEPEFHPYVLRGEADVTARSSVDEGAVKRCREALMRAVADCAEERGAVFPKGLSFSFRVQALHGEAFAVMVQARFRDGQLAGEWCGDYSSVEKFLGQTKHSARKIISDVGVSSSAKSSGGRP